MSVVHVAIPVLKGRSVFTVDKGRSWSPVEHLLLETLSRRRWTSVDLAKASNLPRRVVVEVLTRLMRAGWVELSQADGALQFGATIHGVTAAKASELPAVLERKTRPVSYIIDLIAGDVFRKRDWVVHTESALQDSQATRCIRLEPTSPDSALDPNEIISALLDDDETFVNADRSGTTRRYALVTVRHGAIEGLPAGRDLPVLRQAILAAAAAYPALSETQATPSFSPSIVTKTPAQAKEFKIRISTDDLIIDGHAHREELLAVLENARTIAVIHSTFISSERFFDVFEHIRAAVERGVRVHVLWGQNEELDGLVSTQAAIREIRDSNAVKALGDNFVVHPFSTGSHAKFLIADTGAKNSHVAVVGSCNWLTSGFNSFDVSIRLKDAEIIGELVRKLSSLNPVRDGDWTKFSTELIHLGNRVARGPRHIGQNARASVLVDAQHSEYVLKARDEARTSIVVASHRLGPVAGPSVLTPLSTAVSAHSISAEVYYARIQAPVNRTSEFSISELALEAGVDIKSVRRPRIHAKFVAWDSDNVVISSLNWLSADPVTVQSGKEMGIWIECAGLAKALTDRFYAAMPEE